MVQSPEQSRLAGPTGRQVRTLSLQSLYAQDVRGLVDPEMLDRLCDEYSAPTAVRRAAESMLTGIRDDAENLDALIGRYAPALPVPMLSIVDRNILRVAIYELTQRGHIPRNVVINEAVELAHAFGSESSARFVNGVLGSLIAETPES